MQVLFIEPAYKNKYPPLGLMKLSAFHKQRGDEVCFVKGLDKYLRGQLWDRIYITTMFSFHWAETVKTIKYYEFSVKDPRNLFIGGPMATLMANEIHEETGFIPVKGLLNEKGKLRLSGDHRVDGMVPDYSILEEIKYKYPASNAYFAYMTRGCVRRCPFCAVPKIEPFYVEYVPLRKQIQMINDNYGEKKDLLLLDNNVLASPKFDKIIDEIKEAGFHRGAKLNNSLRYVDFNQGIDLRLLTKGKMRRLAELPIQPLRIAFDHITLKDSYIQKINWAAKLGFKKLSNYILYNYVDTPEDFYERLRINVDLNEKLGTQIYSFPMKYIPVTNKDRKFVGKHWTLRYLRSIQCILQATHGVVSPRKEFFEAAFGRDIKEFRKLLIMPDKYIIYREDHKNNGTAEWSKLLGSLSATQKKDFLRIVHENRFDGSVASEYPEVNTLLEHYKKGKCQASEQHLF
ncbi:MAG: cobalamin-binding domain-containing protein [Nitrospirae bacterium]|nr:cobalamin-binding domain-containing protein [Nitrospirota bacterium]MCL5422946.1 cobalamin-binding domain-containing protein [Nitrospirota bacterium]